MAATTQTGCDATASLVAIVVSASGRIEAREVAKRDRLHADGRLGIERENFMALAEPALEEVGLALSRPQSLRLSDRCACWRCKRPWSITGCA